MEPASNTDVPISVILGIIALSLPLFVALAVWIIKKLYDLTSAVNVLNVLLAALTDRHNKHEDEDDRRFSDHDGRMRGGGL